MAEKIGDNMVKKGISFVKECVLSSVEKLDDDSVSQPRLKVILCISC